MSEEQLQAFLEKAKGDTSLQSKLSTAADADAVVVIAKDAGFIFSADELRSLPSSTPEVSDKELETISGGGQATWLDDIDDIRRSGIRPGKTVIIGKLCK